MRAVVRDRYGPPEVLRVEQVAVPSPRAGQVLVRVVATSVNLSDWEGLRGSPAYARFGGLFRPSRHILGSDIAGVVEAVGSGVTRFRARRRGVRRQPAADGRLRRVRRRTRARARAQARGAVVRPGIDPAAVGSDRGAGGRAGETPQPDADQRRRRRHRRVRDPTRRGRRHPRDRRRQRGQARLHAVARGRRGDRLPRRGLHAQGTVRPHHRPRRAALGVRVSTRARTRRHVPDRRRDDACAAAGGDGRRGRSAPSRVGTCSCWRSSRAPSSSDSSRSAASTARCASTSIGCSRWRRCRRLSRTSARAGRSARSSC